MTSFLVSAPARPGHRRLVGAIAAAAVTITTFTGLATAPAAQAATSPESRFVADINAARHSAGRRPLAASRDLNAVAERWARAMAASSTLRHNPRLTSQVRGWRYVGENVGVGGTVTRLHQAFMSSRPHRANVLDRDYSQVGVGVVSAHGRLWVAEVFRKPASAPAKRKPAARKKAVHHAKKAAPARTYRVGSRGTVVKRIQRVVHARADGIYGPRTRAAVVRWQKRHHLRATGYVTAATRRAMHV